jgi:uncharacterized protein (TIGR03905 family)
MLKYNKKVDSPRDRFIFSERIEERMKTTYTPSGTCSTRIEVDIEDGVINDARFTGGCNGNLQGVSALVKGRDAREVIGLLKGVRCGAKNTSCPDQLARAMERALTQAGQSA